MRVLICGAGQVGYNIAAYLAEEGNDVTVVDQDADLIARINDDLDVSGITGFASSPDVLNEANAGDSDLMIAVTRSDEVNMVACQIGHSLFGVPKKMARIRHQSYLRSRWSNLFSRTHMPIDVIISPEVIVAEDIYGRLSVPGTTYVAKLASGAMHMLGVVCDAECPLVNTPFNQLKTLFPDLKFNIIAILRRGQTIVPDDEMHIEAEDEVFFVVDTKHMKRTLQAFGLHEEEARRIVIAGGGNVAKGLVGHLQERKGDELIKIIEFDQERAQYLSEVMDDVVILNGSSLERDILNQASISKADTFIAVTNDDETNILSSLLAKQYGAGRSITLVNNNVYSPLVGPLGVDSMVSPRSLIVANIMQHVRRGRIKEIHNLRHGFAEVIEAEVSESAKLANTAVGELDLPDDLLIAAIVRNENEVILPDENDVIRVKDHIIMMATQEHVHIVEKLLSVQVDIF